ncbi:hypothetical protein ACFQUU_27360 [Herbaspirillum sp. GCM10030257]
MQSKAGATWSEMLLNATIELPIRVRETHVDWTYSTCHRCVRAGIYVSD